MLVRVAGGLQEERRTAMRNRRRMAVGIRYFASFIGVLLSGCAGVPACCPLPAVPCLAPSPQARRGSLAAQSGILPAGISAAGETPASPVDGCAVGRVLAGGDTCAPGQGVVLGQLFNSDINGFIFFLGVG